MRVRRVSRGPCPSLVWVVVAVLEVDIEREVEVEENADVAAEGNLDLEADVEANLGAEMTSVGVEFEQDIEVEATVEAGVVNSVDAEVNEEANVDAEVDAGAAGIGTDTPLFPSPFPLAKTRSADLAISSSCAMRKVAGRGGKSLLFLRSRTSFKDR